MYTPGHFDICFWKNIFSAITVLAQRSPIQIDWVSWDFWKQRKWVLRARSSCVVVLNGATIPSVVTKHFLIFVTTCVDNFVLHIIGPDALTVVVIAPCFTGGWFDYFGCIVGGGWGGGGGGERVRKEVCRVGVGSVFINHGGHRGVVFTIVRGVATNSISFGLPLLKNQRHCFISLSSVPSSKSLL